MKHLSHVDQHGKAKMVDVSNKPVQQRIAKAKGFIRLQRDTIKLVEENKIKKGDVLTVAELAGIQAAKATPYLIPLCHHLQLSHIQVNINITTEGIEVYSTAKCIGQTGAEMEALTATSLALLTIYDMCKAVDDKMVIEQIYLIEKTKNNI
ncbi:MAG TPA: cyclic pyranopterin monophosphate synthase MoaC [Bacteroidales bacterium]|nr:cyclic pyranopterin monophosphate synthase MoaC [Bacteroidales bacterium]